MKVNGRFLFVIGLAVAMSLAPVRAEEEKETLGDKLKKLFSRPTPSTTPRKHHKKSSPSPSEILSSPGSPSPVPSYGETPSPTATPGTSSEPLEPNLAETPRTQYFEPVRPINPGPRRTPPKIIRAPDTMTTPVPAETATPVPELTPDETSESRPVPSLPDMFSAPANVAPQATQKETGNEKPTATPQEAMPIPNAASTGSPQKIPNSQSPTFIPLQPRAEFEKPKTPLPSPKDSQTPAISIDQIGEAPQFAADIRKLIGNGLDLTKLNLGYKYASADPAKGGLDCSGFIYYVLTKSGFNNVPRDARDQYVWVRKAGNFQSVLGHNDDTFELDGLRPGDLLFWANASGASHEPNITQIMIYIGRDKATNQRLMIGASEHGIYNGQKKSGVGVFDFKLGSAESESDEETSSVFVGYGRFPDLSAN